MKGKKMIDKNYGIAWFGNVRKPFVFDKCMSRGANKGKLRVWLTRGRDAGGNIVRGGVAYIPIKAVVECPPGLVLGVK